MCLGKAFEISIQDGDLMKIIMQMNPGSSMHTKHIMTVLSELYKKTKLCF